MANVFKRQGSPFYYARFQFKGRDNIRSTGKTRKSDAEDELRRMVAAAKGGQDVAELFDALVREFARQSESASRARDTDRLQELARQRSQMARDLVREQRDRVALSDAWDAFIGTPKKREPAERTISGYRGQWRRFFNAADEASQRGWIQRNHPDVVFLHEVTPVVAQDYVADLWGSEVSTSTFNAHLKFLKAMFTALEDRAGLLVNPWARIPTRELEQESRRPLTGEEIATVFRKAKGNLRVMITIGMYTGMRLGDVVHLQWENVDLPGRQIVIIPQKTRRKKKPLALPIHGALEAMLKQHRKVARGPYLFPEERLLYDRDNGSSLAKRIQKFFREDCGFTTNESAEGKHRQQAVSRIGFHALRHSFVTLCAAGGVPQLTITELVGHGSPVMTEKYTQLSVDQKVEALKALPDYTSDKESTDDKDN